MMRARMEEAVGHRKRGLGGSAVWIVEEASPLPHGLKLIHPDITLLLPTQPREAPEEQTESDGE